MTDGAVMGRTSQADAMQDPVWQASKGTAQGRSISSIVILTESQSDACS